MQRNNLIHITLTGLFFCSLLLAGSFWHTPISKADKETIWGVDFSESQAIYLGLDPHETYSAIINDLGAKHIKIHINWDSIEKEKGLYDFTSLDRQVTEAEAHDVKLILVVGMKTGRWPECHAPAWLEQIPPDKRQEEIIRYVDTLVDRYKDSGAVEFWQAENEPFLKFGNCPAWYYKQNTSLVQTEIDTIHKRDSTRKVIVSESGELSDWTKAASMGDIVGVTMYRSTWNKTTETFGINPYTFLTPGYYATKSAFIERRYGKPVIGIELQAEPWTAKSLTESTLEVQAQSMNPELFKENVIFAKQVGLESYYFWGVEWWYWMKTKHNNPEIWNEAKNLMK